MTPSINITVSMPFYDSSSKEEAIQAAGAIIQRLPQQTQLQTEILIKQVPGGSNYTLVSSRHFFSYAIGLAGFTSLFASCVASMLIPAIGSIGIIGVACLLKKKVTVLNSDKLMASSDKVQQVFNKDNLLSQSTPVNSVLNPANDAPPVYNSAVIPPPPPLPTVYNSAVIPPPPPLPTVYNSADNSAPPPPLPPVQQNACSTVANMSLINVVHTGMSSEEDPRASLLASIRERRSPKICFDLEKTKELLMDNPQKYPAGALLEELRSTYERGLKICQNRDKKGDHFLLKTWGKYLEDKGKKFEANFGRFELVQSSNMEELCQKTEKISSLPENMKWAHALLSVLSERADLTEELRKYCKEKAAHTEEHITKLQRNEPKKTKEDKKDVEQALRSKINSMYKGIHGDSSDNESSNEEEWASS